jgi:hypothetical protein
MTAIDEVARPDAEINVSRTRKLIGYGLLMLVPFAVLTAVIVLVAMAANAASATGGCGGG